MKSLFLSVLFVLLSACSAMGVAPASSPSQAVAYGYGEVAALRQQADNGLQSGAISTATAQQVLALTDKARSALDVTEVAINAGAPDNTVASDLQIATSLITQIQALLPAAKPL